MAQKIFQQFGTVRENNLSDIEDLTESLNNLLDKLVDEGSTYISGDLDCIRKISTTSLDNEQFLRFAGNTETVLSPLNKLSTDFTPRKTYQNRLDIIKTFTGVPRFSGGNGPSAYYFNAEQIDPKKLNGDYGQQSLFSSSPDSHADLLNFAIEGSVETGADENSSWTNGVFNYNGRIQDLMKGFGGVVQWEGYFIPIVTGVHQFRIFSSALFHMDWQADDYKEDQFGTPELGPSDLTYVTAKRIGLENTVEVTIIGANKLQLVDLTKQKFIGQQLIASGTNISGENVRIAEFDQETGIITFDGIPVSGSTGTTFTLTLKKELGVSEHVHFKTPVLQKYRRYRVKWRFIMPEQDASGVPLLVQKLPKQIQFDFSTPVDGLANLRYTRLYSHDYDFTDAVKGEMVNFVDNSVLFGGGEVGRENPDLLAAGSVKGEFYKNVTTSKKIDVKYQPKETLESIVKARHTIDTVAGSNLIELSDTSGIEIGTRVFGETVRFIDRESGALLPIEKGAEVIEIVINQGIFLSGNFQTAVTSEELIFIDHRGFVKRLLGDSSAENGVITLKGTAGGGAAISGEDTTDLKDDMIVFGNDGTSGDFNKFTVITLPTNGSTDNVTVSSAKDMDYGIPIAVGNNGSVSNDGGGGYIADGGSANGTRIGASDGGGVPTSGGSGTGLRVNLVITNGSVTRVVINTPGKNYNVGDVITITDSAAKPGQTDATTDYAEFIITSVSPFFYFYQSRGLINDTLIGYCTPNPSVLDTVCLTAAATALATVDSSGNFNNKSIVVEGDQSFSAIDGTNWVVQGSAFSSGEGNDLEAESEIDTINGTTIILKDPLVKNIAKGANFTATKSGGTRILCCPPTDTSPPFLATESGLETTTADPKLVLSDGNLVFDNISAANVPVGDTPEIGEGGNVTVNTAILIETAVTRGDPTDTNNQGKTFKILSYIQPPSS